LLQQHGFFLLLFSASLARINHVKGLLACYSWVVKGCVSVEQQTPLSAVHRLAVCLAALLKRIIKCNVLVLLSLSSTLNVFSKNAANLVVLTHLLLRLSFFALLPPVSSSLLHCVFAIIPQKCMTFHQERLAPLIMDQASLRTTQAPVRLASRHEGHSPSITRYREFPCAFCKARKVRTRKIVPPASN